jgi:hypothetical protein
MNSYLHQEFCDSVQENRTIYAKPYTPANTEFNIPIALNLHSSVDLRSSICFTKEFSSSDVGY